jgi:hypothetical protein
MQSYGCGGNISPGGSIAMATGEAEPKPLLPFLQPFYDSSCLWLGQWCALPAAPYSLDRKLGREL